MKTVGQTLFLGASVISFSSNIGWGGNNSSITVELIEDTQPFGKIPFRKFSQNKSADYGDLAINSSDPLPSGHPGERNLGSDFYAINHYKAGSYTDNHYYTCSGDDCYVDEFGIPYNTSQTKKEKNIPGKIYYEWVDNIFVSKYWYAEDPGFFATGTRINNNGVYEPAIGRTVNSNDLYIYDIINTPVYFKFDNFEFIGLVKSWERNNRPGGVTYSVTIESFDEVLDNSHIILQSFNGAIFNLNTPGLQSILSDLSSAGILPTISRSKVGGPINFPSANTGNFDQKIKYGNLPNVFNVYGFLEAMGNGGFGGSRLNSEGLRANDIIDSIHALVSSNTSSNHDKAFSPFGRILTKTISNARDSSIVYTMRTFGIISPNIPGRTRSNQNYNSFSIDLSSLPRPPDGYRIQGNPSLSILQFIRQICDDTGADFLSVVVPVLSNGTIEFVIKILTVNRTNYTASYEIPTVVTTLENNGYLIENSSFGQEKNNNFTRKLVFGGNQQRLYQVKNYRLSYTQTNYVYNGIIKKFVNLDSSEDRNRIGKARMPDISSTRNKFLSDYINPLSSTIFLREDDFADTRFSIPIEDFSDAEIGRTEKILAGNYKQTLFVDNDPGPGGTRGSRIVYDRFVPLFKDIISPYFGTRADNKTPAGDDSNEFRIPRPVLLDTWTNQITVVFSLEELPILSIGEMISTYDPSVFSKPTPGDHGSGMDGKNSTMTGGQKPDPKPTDFGKPASSGILPTRTLESKNPGFTIKETEFRCPNFDSYLTYCLGKSIYSKPDLFVMLTNAYKAKGIFVSRPNSNTSSLDGSGMKGKAGITTSSNINDNGTSGKPEQGIRTKMDINWDQFLNHNFIKDLQIIFEFIKNISDTYYGKKYAIIAPTLYSYKDTQYGTIQLPTAIGDIAIYQGNNEILYDYELVDGAWEEYGNYIDDSIVCGDNNWHALRNEDGLIPTILGYNASSNIDDVADLWCKLTVLKKNKLLSSKGTILKKDLTVREARRLSRDLLQCSSSIYIPSIDISSIEQGSYVIVQKNQKNNEAFGRKTPSAKLYYKSNTDNIVFMNPITLTDPRIIVNAPGISLSTASNSYISDPNLTVISNIAIEDFCIVANMMDNGINTEKELSEADVSPNELEYLKYLLSIVYPIEKYGIDDARLVRTGSSSNNSAQHAMVEAKMATPFFAAIPLKTNRAVYGPWINYPGLVMNSELADNLIGNIKIEQNSDYVPWNYGGMSYLDKVVDYAMNADVNYQNIIENGRVSIVGPPVFGIGGTFSYDSITNINQYRNNSNYIIYDNNYYRPENKTIIFFDTRNSVQLNYPITTLGLDTLGASALISNISIQTSTDGIRTSYSFQTYNPKTGIFNKQFSDNIRKQTSQNLKFNKLLSDKSNTISNSIRKNILDAVEKSKQSREPYSISKKATDLFGTSPVECFIGKAEGFVPVPTGLFSKDDFNNIFRNHHYAGIFPGAEIGAELMNDYDSKSAMTIDGLLSPISFYPTRLYTTFSISDHSLKESGNIIPVCPRCSNDRKVTITYVDYNTATKDEKEIIIACPTCSKSAINFNNKKIAKASTPENINIYSLNPIIVSTGEFKNPHAGSGVAKHNILAISRGENVPTGERSFLSRSNIGIDNYDYEQFDLDTGLVTNQYTGMGSGILMNQRFFGLRGPLMLHGWGFDTDGYPVPNRNDEPYMTDEYNRPMRFVMDTGTGMNDLSKEGKFIPDATEPRLGDIVTINYEFDKTISKWTKKSPTKSEFFHTRWGERPDLWPVGPIDLRWDERRKVWDTGGCKEEVLPPYIISNKNDLTTLEEFLKNKNISRCPYKMVYITLEQDMVKEEDNSQITKPTRGFIDDIEYSKETLPNNYRRIVYIIDTAGYTAPRGVKLLCRYNRDNGFYEPITKPILTALGSIVGTQAKIEMSYTSGRRSGVLPVYVTNFDNPLNLRIRDKGLFNYINGKWTLISS